MTNSLTQNKSMTGGMMLALFAVCLVAIMPDNAFAGTGGASFDDIWVWLKDNIQGTLGRSICGAIVTVGIIAGIARQSLMSFAVGIGGGMGLYNTPTVLESLVSATLPTTVDILEKAVPMLLHISNGM